MSEKPIAATLSDARKCIAAYNALQIQLPAETISARSGGSRAPATSVRVTASQGSAGLLSGSTSSRSAGAPQGDNVGRPVWFVGENFRFEKAFDAAGELVKEIGPVLKIDLVADVSLPPKCATE
jgi:hypothetical protein